MYIIYYREIQSDRNKADWLQIPITQLKETTYAIPLKCDREYEIAMSVKDEKKEGKKARKNQVVCDRYTFKNVFIG